jgi:hypothetical protein
VVGAESTPCDEDAQQGGYVVQHIMALKRQPAFHRSRFVIIVEVNYGGPIWATTIAAAISTHNLTNVEVARRDKRGLPAITPGVFTNPQNKPDMMERLKRAFEYRAIYFADKFVSVCVPSKDAQTIVNEILCQCLGFRIIYKKDETGANRPTKVILSGKEGPEGKDDLVDVLAMNLYWNKLVA